MAGPAYLKVTLKLMALYAVIMGAFTLFFHEAGQFVFQYDIKDPLLARYWGGVLIALSVFYVLLSYDPKKYRQFLWVGVFDQGISMIITVLQISAGFITWLQGITGLVLNPIFIVILLYGLAKEPEGEVVLFAGPEKEAKAGQELPPHIYGHHPLERK